METSPQPSGIDLPARTPFDGRVPPPKYATLHTTRFCNLRCTMCLFVANGTVITGPHMEPNLVDKFTDEVLPVLDRIHLTVSGEPLMTQNLPHLLEKAARYGVRVDLLTNGMLLNERMIQLLLPSVAHLNVSFDAPTKETFEAIRVGGDFDKILGNLRRFCELAQQLPEAQRPIVGMRCTLMERNIREAPQMVDLAVDLGIDHLCYHHLHPFVNKMKPQCLVHHQDLAVEYINRSLARAEELGLPVQIDALGTIAAETALVEDEQRTETIGSGVIPGLEGCSVNLNLLRSPPGRDPADPNFESIERLRSESDHHEKYPVQRELSEKADASGGEKPDSVWICDRLWDRAHIGLKGEVRPCCIPGNPVIGDLRKNSFDEIWNGPVYRTMRTHLIAKQPMPVCQGCQWIKEIDDPVKIENFLNGAERTERKDLTEPAYVTLGIHLDLKHKPLIRGVEVPVLEWESVDESRGYEVEISKDGFTSLVFCSTWHQPLLDDCRYELPEWAWRESKEGAVIAWRAIAYVDGNRIQAAIGRLVRESGAE